MKIYLLHCSVILFNIEVRPHWSSKFVKLGGVKVKMIIDYSQSLSAVTNVI